MLLRALTRPRRVAPPRPQLVPSSRAQSRDAKPTTPQVPEPQEHRRSWFWTAQRFSNFVVIPAAIFYCVFFADYGDKEHVFSPPRRWLQRQRDAFFSLTPEERQLASEDSHEHKSSPSTS